MLTELKLANFRIFDDEVSVRFRPITVLIGRNSSGKSSIIKFLLMLQQSLDPGNPQFLSPEGDRVRLGVFSELKNALTRKRNLAFQLATKMPNIRPGPAISERLASLKDVGPEILLYKTGATVSYITSGNIGRSNSSLVKDSSGKSLVRVVARILEDSIFLDRPSQSGVEKAVARLSQSMGEEGEMSLDDLLNEQNLWLAKYELLGMLRYQINSIRHLSAVRDESQRVILASPPPVDYVGQRGQYALPHLQQMTEEDEARYQFILPHLGNVAGIDGIDFSTSLGYISRCYAKNKATGANVPIADYGFGVSQCLPIFVQGAIMSPYTSLMVEQPEAQLHPTAQLEMGSFFADLWQKRNVGSVIETHSDNILLRLRRLIAKRKLSHEDVSVAFFTFDENNGNMPVVKNLDINEDGSMQPGLPMEFFGADVIEGLNLGARK